MEKNELQLFEYDVAFSFAGEDRDYVSKVASILRSQNVAVYYDDFLSVNMWGKDLYVYLDEVYRKKARYCILFLSRHYALKAWTNHERKSAQARAFESNQEYILPARFDTTEIPGVPPTVAYIDLVKLTPEAFSEIILRKLGKLINNNSVNTVKHLDDSVENPVEKDKGYGTKFIEEELPKIVKKMMEERITPAVVFVDIDGLTVINKTHGWEVGNIVLDAIYKIIKRRSFGMVKYRGRCGDDTFYSVLFEAEKVIQYCELIRNDVISYRWQQVTPDLHVSCTIGYAELKPDEDPHEWLARAIIGILEGKKHGSNTIQIGPLFSGMKFESKPEQRTPSLPKTKLERLEYYSEDPPFSLRRFFS